MIDKTRRGASIRITPKWLNRDIYRVDIDDMQFFSPTMQRVLAGLALCAAFLVMASVFVPVDTGAMQTVPLVPHEYDPASVDPHEDLQSIGSLEQACSIVYIFATEHGPRYTIYDRQEDRIVATLVAAERVQELFPNLPLPEIDFSAPQQLMYASPDMPGY